jgi:hypothetical protein
MSVSSAKALLQSRLALAVSDTKVKGRKTRAGQVKALAEAQTATAKVEAPNWNLWSFTAENCWQLPMTFGTGSAFEKAVIVRENRDKAGMGNLKLLAQYNDDVVMLAVWRGYAQQVKAQLLERDASTHNVNAGKVSEATGDRETCACFACEVEVALRDERTMEQLLADAEQSDAKRYSWEADYVSPATGEVIGRMRTRTPKAAKVKARRIYETRLAFIEYVATQPLELATLTPETGQVFKNVFAEMRAGYKRFANVVQGYTMDGLISDDVSYVAYHRHDLEDKGFDRAVARLDRSIEREQLTTLTSYTERDLERKATFDTLYAKADLLPAEAKALAAVELLANGYTFAEVLEAFEYKQASKLNAHIRDAKALIAEAQASDVFAVYRNRAIAEAMQEAVNDLASA